MNFIEFAQFLILNFPNIESYKVEVVVSALIEDIYNFKNQNLESIKIDHVNRKILFICDREIT